MKTYRTKEEVIDRAKDILGKSLREVLSSASREHVLSKLGLEGIKNKGTLGQVIEESFFEIMPGNVSAPDFPEAEVELKTTPIKKHTNKEYVSKERLVFSMIDYSEIGRETWLESSFLKKNKRLLMMFYLWMEANSILDFKFKFIHFLDLLTDISKEDVLQIQKDWEYIVAKIKRGDAHLLSEGDTYYLGACTKAANNKVTRVQFVKDRPDAKPRAFSLKQQYLNYLIQTKLLKKNITTESIFKKVRRVETIEDAVKGIFTPFLGTTDKEILKKLGLNLNKGAKGYKRSIVNRIFGVNSGRIEELEKANITLKVLTLESTGTLKESVAFRAFKFKELVNEVWYDEIEEEMADFHFQLESRKFLFVVFQKQKNSQDIVLMKTMFWNFPIVDMPKAEEVWKKTINLINEGQIIKEVRIMKNGKERVLTHFPGLVFNGVAHVRPHAQIAADTELLPIPDQHTGRKEMTKQCFWLNAKYVERAIQGHNE